MAEFRDAYVVYSLRDKATGVAGVGRAFLKVRSDVMSECVIRDIEKHLLQESQEHESIFLLDWKFLEPSE